MSTVVTFPLPSQFSHEGLDVALAERFECQVEWVANHEVTLPGKQGYWSGFVHEFQLIGHPRRQRCFVVRCAGDLVYTYLEEDQVRDADDAVRRMLREDEG